jgi:hypothetical protein
MILQNGVKGRTQSGGDNWANEHRKALPTANLLQDVDCIVGTFAQNSGNSLYMEFVPDGYANKGKIIRKFGIVALFDRKESRASAFDNPLSTALYLHIARTISTQQPTACKFFLVIGRESPWTFVELDINTGEPTGLEAEVKGNDWTTFWDTLGISNVHSKLKQWIQ